MERLQAKPKLRVLTEGSSGRAVIRLPKGQSTIGRSNENTIVLRDSLVSRQHAVITFDGQEVVIRDLGAKNPVRVNGKDVTDTKLEPGDRISIGHTELLFEFDSTDDETPVYPLKVVKGNGSFDTGSGISLDAATTAFDRPDLSHAPAAEKRYDHLRQLYVLSEQILNITEEEELYDVVLSAATQVAGAERGFLGLPTEGHETDPYSLNVVRFWDPVHGVWDPVQGETPEMSETILSHIQRDRKAVLVRDVPDRPDFGVSVIDLKIRSFLCAPLIHGDRFLGLIYVDTRGSREQFDRSDLEFVSAIGRIAGLSLQNVRDQVNLQRENENLRSLVGGGQELIGRSENMQKILTLIEKVAPRDTSVLITGENGTGKELIARAIHNKSPRRDRPFVAVNCGAIPPNLVESELFGYEKGAFTGAHKTTEGKFDLAGGGTLFLDEIGEMPLDMQVKILRATQDQKFYRVGGKEEISVDIRVISATNRDLKQATEEGAFREDLFFRLAVVTLEVPPLRERGNDVLEIAEHFVSKGSSPITLTKAARDCLLKYDWPGNIRELRNALEQAVILGDGKKIAPSDLPSKIVKSARGRMAFRLKPLSEVEKQYIQRVLDETDGNKARAAAVLGISRETLYQKLRQYQREN